MPQYSRKGICKICNIEYEDLTRHSRDRHDGGDRTAAIHCRGCHKGFDSRYTLLKHCRKYHKKLLPRTWTPDALMKIAAEDGPHIHKGKSRSDGQVENGDSQGTITTITRLHEGGSDDDSGYDADRDPGVVTVEEWAQAAAVAIASATAGSSAASAIPGSGPMASRSGTMIAARTLSRGSSVAFATPITSPGSTIVISPLNSDISIRINIPSGSAVSLDVVPQDQ